MRINKYVAQATDLSRRAADSAIAEGRVLINGSTPEAGATVQSNDTVTLDGQIITPRTQTQTIILHKPVGYVCSREGQGSKTIYDLLPKEYHHLNSVGRLDKDSSGLLLLTDNGQLAQELTHPSYQKDKIYEIELDRPLSEPDRKKAEQGVELDDGLSQFKLIQQGTTWVATLHEGRNRQIRRTFDALGYKVTKLHRTHFGEYTLGSLKSGDVRVIQPQKS